MSDRQKVIEMDTADRLTGAFVKVTDRHEENLWVVHSGRRYTIDCWQTHGKNSHKSLKYKTILNKPKTG